MEGGRHHLCVLPLPHTRSPAPPEKEFVQTSGTPAIMATTQGTSLEHLVLVASSAYGSHRTVANKQFPTSLSAKRADRNAISQSSSRGVFAYFKSCCLRIQFPISLHLSAELRSIPFGTLTGLGTLSTTESH